MSDVSGLDAQLTADSSKLSVDPAWARVRILLNQNRAAAATTETLPLLDHLVFGEREYVSMAGAGVYGMGDIPQGWVFIDPARYRILINADVLFIFSMSALVASWMTPRFRRAKQPGWKRYDYAAWCAAEPWLLEDGTVEDIEDWLNGLT